MEEIVTAIQDFDGLQALRLEGNTIGVEAAKTIAKALETKSEIKVFSGPHSASLSSLSPPQKKYLGMFVVIDISI